MDRGCHRRGWRGGVVGMALVGLVATAARADWFVDGPGVPAEACETYVLAEALAMQRSAGPGGVFAIDGDTQLPVLTADSPQFAVAPGARLLYGRHGPAALGWEVGYVGVYGMFADAVASGTGTLEIAPFLADGVIGMRNATLASATYTSAFDSAEANVLLTRQNFRPARVSAYAHEDSTRVITWDWLAGFRWAGLSEAASITMTQAGGLTDTYSVRTSNNLYGGQLGFKGRADWGLWALDGWLKAGLAATDITGSQAPILDSVAGGTFRPAGVGRAHDVAGIFDIDIAVSRRLSEHWAVRVGWNSIWLTGVALATNQFDFSNSSAPVTTVADGGTLWLNGVSLGLEGRW